jgi:hypothetical protein
LIATEDTSLVENYFDRESLLYILSRTTDLYRANKFSAFYYLYYNYNYQFTLMKRTLLNQDIYRKLMKEIFFLELLLEIVEATESTLKDLDSIVATHEKMVISENTKNSLQPVIFDGFQLLPHHMSITVPTLHQNEYELSILGVELKFRLRNEMEFFIKMITSIKLIKNKEDFKELLELILGLMKFINSICKKYNNKIELIYSNPQEVSSFIEDIENEKNLITSFHHLSFMNERKTRSYQTRIGSSSKNENIQVKLKLKTLSPEEFYSKQLICFYIRSALIFLKTFYSKKNIIENFDKEIEKFIEEYMEETPLFEKKITSKIFFKIKHQTITILLYNIHIYEKTIKIINVCFYL